MSRPEVTGHAALYYNAKEARKYDSSSRMVGVQREITERAMELLKLSNHSSTTTAPCLILDIGCGSGLSGQVLEEYGHVWVGCDISRDMLQVAKERMDDRMSTTRRRNTKTDDDNDDNDSSNDDEDDQQGHDDDDDASMNDEDTHNKKQKSKSSSNSYSGDLIHHDMGTGLPFRAATFDACISISALQWLCYSNSNTQVPKQRLARFFSSLYTVLKRSGRAVLQFYPETADQAVLISQVATQVGFAGGIVVDYPNSAKAKKHYLVLTSNRSSGTSSSGGNNNQIPRGRQLEDATASAVPDGSLLHRHHHHQAVRMDSAGTATSNNNNHNSKHSKQMVPRKKKGNIKTKEWIVHKKQTQRQKGKAVRPDTKYTARRRPTKF